MWNGNGHCKVKKVRSLLNSAPMEYFEAIVQDSAVRHSTDTALEELSGKHSIRVQIALEPVDGFLQYKILLALKLANKLSTWNIYFDMIVSVGLLLLILWLGLLMMHY